MSARPIADDPMCKCTCHAPAQTTAVAHVHAYGPGYYDLVGGTKVKHTQICRECGDVKETDMTKAPQERKSKGPSITGLSSGERFSR